MSESVSSKNVYLQAFLNLLSSLSASGIYKTFSEAGKLETSQFSFYRNVTQYWTAIIWSLIK